MPSELLPLDEYCVFTFATTSYALKAEKELQAAEAEFIIMPTLREISSSCGLSIKMYPDTRESLEQVLADRAVPVEAIYQVKREGKVNRVIKVG